MNENRRFWPVRLTKINLRALRADRDQLWAEAVVRYRAGEAWHITDPFLLAAAKAEQARRLLTHPWERPIAEHLANLEVQRTGITTHEILVLLKIKPVDHGKGHEQWISSVLKKLGWGCFGKQRKKIGQHRVRRFFPGPESGPGTPLRKGTVTDLSKFRATRKSRESTHATPEKGGTWTNLDHPTWTTLFAEFLGKFIKNDSKWSRVQVVS